MFKVYWTEEAEQDLENILSYYLDQAGTHVAGAIYRRIREQVGSLNSFPESTRPGRVPGTREFVVTRLPYIAIVDIGADRVSVLNVVHTARKYPADAPT